MQATKHDDQLVITVLLRPVPLDLLGYCIDELVSGDDRYLSWVQEYYCGTNLVHHMFDCGNGVSLISQRGSRAVMLTSNGALLFLDASWADHVTFTAPSTYSVTQLFSIHSYSSAGCVFSKSIPGTISPSALIGKGFFFLKNAGRILV